MNIPVKPPATPVAPPMNPRTRALLQGPIVPTLFRLAWPNVLIMFAQAATGLIETFWVGRLGSAYIRGLHSGSGGQIAVIGKHFPGVGGSDRPIEEEVSTVRKSLER